MSTQDYSDWRALHHARAPFGQQLAAARAITHPELRAVAVRETWRQMDVAQVASEAEWITRFAARDVFNASAVDRWHAVHRAVTIADHRAIDLQDLALRWATVPARDALTVWESWAHAHDFGDTMAPRRAIDAADAWWRGELAGDALETARAAARAVSVDAKASNLLHAHAAGSAASSAAAAAAAASVTYTRRSCAASSAANAAAHALFPGPILRRNDDAWAQAARYQEACAARALAAIREVHLGA